MEFYGRTKFSLKIISQEGMHFRTTKPKRERCLVFVDKYHSRDVFHALYSSRLPGSQLGKPYKKKLGRADKYMTSSLERKISI